MKALRVGIDAFYPTAKYVCHNYFGAAGFMDMFAEN
jgi:hypothetical protein